MAIKFGSEDSKVSKKRLTAVSLFSGCGGFDLGFESAGFEILEAHDIDPVAVQNYNKNLEPVARISDVSVPAFSIPLGVDLVISGSPCQGFSLVGKRELLDPRNSLLLTACYLVTKSRPKAAIFENVPGALSGAHKTIWDSAVQILQDGGYNVRYETIAMHEYGLAQMRKRVILIALRDREPFSLKETMAKTLPPSLFATLKCAENHSSGTTFYPILPDTADWRIAANIGPGMKLCDVRAGPRSVHSWNIPEVFGETDLAEKKLLLSVLNLRRKLRRRPTGDADPVELNELILRNGADVIKSVEKLAALKFLNFDGEYVDLTRRFNGKYRRVSWDSPSYTVDTNFGNPRYFIHPDLNRGFSVREAARIQSFPDDYHFSGSTKDQFRIIGNAVPPLIRN